MIAHTIQFDQTSEFSPSGAADDVLSVYWEPDLTSVADPFATSDFKLEPEVNSTIVTLPVHAHLPWGGFSSPPSPPSPTGIGSSHWHGTTTVDPGSWQKSLSATLSAAVIVLTNPGGVISQAPSLASDETSNHDSNVEAVLEQLPSYQGGLVTPRSAPSHSDNLLAMTCSRVSQLRPDNLKISNNQRPVAIRTVGVCIRTHA
jgi:hypothetical protein